MVFNKTNNKNLGIDFCGSTFNCKKRCDRQAAYMAKTNIKKSISLLCIFWYHLLFNNPNIFVVWKGKQGYLTRDKNSVICIKNHLVVLMKGIYYDRNKLPIRYALI